LGIDLDHFLGVGDSVSDWQFIYLCKYAGAMGNASEELKELVRSKKDDGFIGGDVNNNGILEIFKYYKLL